jgi:hypothetical protein
MKIINNILSKAVLTGLFSLAMFACSGSGDYLPVNEEENSSQVKAYMTVNLASSVSSRTEGNLTEAGINTDENKIARLAIALVNTSNNSVFLFTNPTLITSPDGLITARPFLMPIGTYRIVLVANPTDAVISKLNNANDYASLQVAMSEINTFATSNSFMMTNAVNYKGDVTNIPEVSVTAANTEANPAKPANPIYMDRMAAKIRMQSGMATTFKINNAPVVLKKFVDGAWTTVSYNNVVMKSYALLNTYQKANLYQSWSATSATNNQLLVTPNSASDYVAADFANGMDSYSTRTKDATSTNNSGYTALVDLSRASTASMTDLSKVSYCLENNSKAVGSPLSTAVNSHVYYTKNQNTTTGVLFRTQLVDDNNKGVTFYSYNGKYYADLASILADHSNVFTTKAKTYTVADVAAMTNPDIRTNFGVKVYEDGYIYYTHFIYDVNYTDPAAAADVTNNRYYAVLRNSIYDMNVTGIKKVGDDIPGGWDYVGTDPIDKKEAYMQIELTVSPWILDFYSTILK